MKYNSMPNNISFNSIGNNTIVYINFILYQTLFSVFIKEIYYKSSIIDNNAELNNINLIKVILFLFDGV